MSTSLSSSSISPTFLHPELQLSPIGDEQNYHLLKFIHGMHGARKAPAGSPNVSAQTGSTPYMAYRTVETLPNTAGNPTTAFTRGGITPVRGWRLALTRSSR